MKQARIAIGIAALAASGVACAAASSGPTVYKWVDEQGVTHYGDSIPPQYAQGASSELNRQGVVVGHIEGRKDAAQAAEQERAEAAARQQSQHDQFLLSTYTSAQDISQLRDERLGQIEAQIQAANTYIESLDSRLAGLQERASHYQPYSSNPKAPRMPDDLAQQLARTSSESRSQRAALATKRKEATATRAQFEADIARYTELAAQRQNAR